MVASLQEKSPVLEVAENLQATHDLMGHLGDAKEKFEQIVQELPHPFFIVTENLVILRANHVAKGFFRQSNDQPFPSILQLFAESEQAQFKRHIAELNSMKADEHREFELSLREQHPSGKSYLWQLRRLRGISARRGHLFYVCGYNISKTNDLVGSIQSQNDRLVEQSEQMQEMVDTISRQQLQVHETARLAELGEMAGNIAHEINNPVAIIKGYADQLVRFLESENLDQKMLLKFGTRISATAERINKIVKNMRTLARDAQNDPFCKEQMSEIITEVFDIFGQRIKNLGIQSEFTEVGGEVIVSGRRVQISQVFVNLFNNAIDALAQLPEDERWLSVRLIKKEVYTIIEVANAGSPIPKEVAENIMKPFFTTKEMGKGTGLGLSISSKIMAEHEGELVLDQTKNHPCFVVKLPLATS